MLDAVVVGGGAAGLALAAHLAAGGWQDRRVVVLDDPAPPQHTTYVPAGAPAPSPDEVGTALTGYLDRAVAAGQWRVVGGEHGSIPLLTGRTRRRGARVLRIGAAAGLVRPCSGYGFDAVHRDAAAVTRSLKDHGHPFALPRTPWRHRALDAVFLRTLAREPEALERAFVALFAARDPLRVLRFLDHDSTRTDDLRLVAGMPAGPFLRGLAAGPRR